jgi:hypothetical protein
MTTRTIVKNEPRDHASQTIQPTAFQLNDTSKGGVFSEYEAAANDIMVFSNRLVFSTYTKIQDEMQIVTPTPYQKMQTKHVTPAEILMERLTDARKRKVLCDSKSFASAPSSKSSVSAIAVALMKGKGCLPHSIKSGKVQDIRTIPIPDKLPKSTSRKQKDSELLWSYREARKTAKKRKEASIRKAELSQKVLSSDWYNNENGFASTRCLSSRGMDQQRLQEPPEPLAYLNFDLSPFTNCVSPSLDAVVSSTSCMAMSDRSFLPTIPVNDPRDTNHIKTTRPYFTRLTTETEPRLAEKQEKENAIEEKTFRKLAKLKREVVRLQRQQIDAASTAPAAAAAATAAHITPPSKVSDSSLATPRSCMSGQGSNSSAYSSETRREVRRIKQELRELRQVSTTNRNSESSRSILSQDSFLTAVTTTLAPTQRTKVRFSYPLVTQVNLRPWTLEADIEALYFCPEELDELEWDRETTEADQYECIAQEQSSRSSVNNVAIAHKLKRYEKAETGDDDVTVATDDQSFCSSETDLISNAATE